MALTGVVAAILWWKHPRILPKKAEWHVQGHASGVSALVFSPDGETLASRGIDGTIKLWNVANGSLRQTFAAQGAYIRALTFSPNGRLVAIGGNDYSVQLWDTKTGRLVDRLSGHTSGVTALAFSADGRTLVSGSGYRGTNVPVDMFRPLPGRCTAPLGMALVWTLDGPVSSAELAGGEQIRCLAFSPDGSRLAGGSLECRVTLWDTATYKPVHSVDYMGYGSLVAVAFFAGGKRLLCLGECEGDVRDTTSLDKISDFKAHARTASAVLSPDDKLLATCGARKAVDRQNTSCEFKLWDVNTRALLYSEERAECQVIRMAFSPDGQSLAVATSNGKVEVWKLVSLLAR